MSIKNITKVTLVCVLLPSLFTHAAVQISPTTSKPTKEFIYKKTPQEELKIYLDFPEDWKASDRRPAIVFFGGGAWSKQTPDQFVSQAGYLASRGMVTARAAYRVMRKHKTTPFECVEDAKSAVRWIRKNAEKFGIDPDRIVASGGSAGGHMAACTALVDEFDAKDEELAVSSKPNALVLFNPVLDLEPMVGMNRPKARNRFPNPQDALKISPYHHLAKGVPPTLILFGSNDRLGQPAPAYIKKSKELGNRAELYIEEGQKHGFFNRSPSLEKTLYRTDEFLATLGYTKGKPTLKMPKQANQETKKQSAPTTQQASKQKSRVLRNLEYGRAGNKPLLLDLYLPPNPEGKPLPLLVWIHGGAWRKGSKANCSRVRGFLDKGYAGASIGYRLSHQATFPAQIHDCKAAIRWLRANAKKYNYNPHRIGVWGASAGGHLVALLGTSGDVKELEGDLGTPGISSRVQAVCDLFGPSDFLNRKPPSEIKTDLGRNDSKSPVTMLLGGPVEQNQEKARLASPITFVSKDDPPFLIMHGDKDPVVPYRQSVLLYEALKKNGVEVTLHPVKGAGHGFKGLDISGQVEEFFNKHLKKPEPQKIATKTRGRKGRRSREDVYSSIKWDNPLQEKFTGVQHNTFFSKAMNQKVGFNIYTPPNYAAGNQRYPAIYWLHGLGGNESAGVRFSQVLHKAIVDKQVPPMIMVFVNGGKGSMYSDSVDRTIMSETAIIKELIPFVDKNYRTIAARRGRAIEGFSMGGFGAIKLACKFPELFCSVVAGGPALHDWTTLSTGRKPIAQRMFNNDQNAFRDNCPYELVKKNKDKISGKLRIRIVHGSREKAVKRYTAKFRKLLEELKIPHQFELIEGVGHDVKKVYQLAGVKGFKFQAQSFAGTPDI
ncbi:MAG: alpha/beta hydrolase fold domain-containing protein [Planctomycetota bacterium]|jgi:acetyl esterase/lipase/S-formylglutathione hydrolase FrmB